jgi:hypothetical protein
MGTTASHVSPLILSWILIFLLRCNQIPESGMQPVDLTFTADSEDGSAMVCLAK